MERKPVVGYDAEERNLRKVREKARKLESFESLEEQKKRASTRAEYKTKRKSSAFNQLKTSQANIFLILAVEQEVECFHLLRRKVDKKVYDNLMDILRLYTEELITKENLESLAKQLFGNNQDSYFCFLQFISFDTNHMTDLKSSFYGNLEEKEPKLEELLDEVNLLISLNGRTIRELQRIIEEVHYQRTFSHIISLDSIHLKNIQRIYGSSAHEMILNLRKDPLVVAPVILKRLRQKQLEWAEIGSEEEQTQMEMD